MSGKSPIQWTAGDDGTAGFTWNPLVGCTRVSPGCDHCYAFALHDMRHIAWKRGTFPTAPKQYHVPFSRVQLLPERLNDPLHWRKPRRVFVNSMADLFHEQVPDEFIQQVFSVMRQAKRHTFQVLTKRPERMKTLINRWYSPPGDAMGGDPTTAKTAPNIWLGVSVENQQAAHERIPLLAETPAAVRFLSMEPLLERVDIDAALGLEAEEPAYPWEPMIYHKRRESVIDWVIVGGESGLYARRFYPEWAPREQCRAAGVPIFIKQLGTVWARANHAHHSHGGNPDEWPEHLRIREYPQTDRGEAA